MIRRMLLAVAALGCLAGPAPAQPGGGKTDEPAAKFAPPPQGFDRPRGEVK